MAAGLTLYAGAALVLDGGYAKPATAAAGLVGIGRAEEQVDNSAGADGAVNVRVWPGVCHSVNSSGADAIAVTGARVNERHHRLSRANLPRHC